MSSHIGEWKNIRKIEIMLITNEGNLKNYDEEDLKKLIAFFEGRMTHDLCPYGIVG